MNFVVCNFIVILTLLLVSEAAPPVRSCVENEICAWGHYEGSETKTETNHNLNK